MALHAILLEVIESRLHKVERDVNEIKTKMDCLATKADIKQMQMDIKKEQTKKAWWTMGVFLPLFIAAVGFFYSGK